MSAFNLSAHRTWFLEQAYPAYQTLGNLAFAYMQGSLVSGYTATADLDVVLVWDQARVPAERVAVIARLDQSGRVPAFVVDYEEVHLERFTRTGQEYNIGHHALADFRALIEHVQQGGGRAPAPILTPLVAVAGFAGGDMVADPHGIGMALRKALSPFPAALRQSTRQEALSRRSELLGALLKYAERQDWLVFHTTLVEAVKLVLPAVFAATNAYYPGDKWVGLAIKQIGLPPAICTIYTQLWTQGALPLVQIEALEQLFAFVEGKV